MNKNLGDFHSVVINQPLGLGDIIFIQPIVHKFLQLGKAVIHPISDHYFEAICRHMPTPGVTYKRVSDDFPLKSLFNNKNIVKTAGFLYLPLTFSHLHFPEAPLMISKYLLCGLSVSDWRPKVNICRDLSRESKLIFEIGPVVQPYALVNRHFGSAPNITKAVMRGLSLNQKNVIEIDPGQKFSFETTPFDYIGLIGAASEIHFVESSMTYLADLYARSLECRMVCYSRFTFGEHTNYQRNTAFVHQHNSWEYML